jgi:hypothetical protein
LIATSPIDAGAGLLYSRGWVIEFISRGLSFEKIQTNNASHSYEIASAFLTLKSFEKARWIENPWALPSLPEDKAFNGLRDNDWGTLEKCQARRRGMVNLRDIVQMHISQFSRFRAPFLWKLEFAPPDVKVMRMGTRVMCCLSGSSKGTVPFEADSLEQFVLGKDATASDV